MMKFASPSGLSERGATATARAVSFLGGKRAYRCRLRKDRSKGQCCHSVASAKRASAHKEEAMGYSQLQLT